MPVKDQSSLPMPPYDLLQRIGPMGEADPEGKYLETGRFHREFLDAHLPEDWSWSGKRVLDFGCGVGRMLRQFAEEAGEGEFYGCDLDAPSVSWMRANMSPPFEIFETSENGGLPQEDGFFDLIYCFSVYTHFTHENWATWLLEHHRALADGGILFATILGPGMLEPLTGEVWDEDRIGMNPLLYGYPWDQGGPIAINSEWWIRARWGRAFEILTLVPQAAEGGPSHGIVVARKKPTQITVDELLALEPGEPREIKALQHHVEQLADETVRLRHAHEQLVEERTRLEGVERAYGELISSNSWRVTAPLRAAKRLRPRR